MPGQEPWEVLERLEAPADLTVWGMGRTRAELWSQCPRADWLLWLYARVGPEPQRTLVRVTYPYVEAFQEHWKPEPQAQQIIDLVTSWLEDPEQDDMLADRLYPVVLRVLGRALRTITLALGQEREDPATVLRAYGLQVVALLGTLVASRESMVLALTGHDLLRYVGRGMIRRVTGTHVPMLETAWQQAEAEKLRTCLACPDYFRGPSVAKATG